MTYKTVRKSIISACKKRDFYDIPTEETISDKNCETAYNDYLNSTARSWGWSFKEFLMNCSECDLDYYAFK